MLNKISILSVLLLLSFSSGAQDYGYPANPGVQKNTSIVKKTDLPLVPSIQLNMKQPLKKSFRGMDVEGWLLETGDWHITGTVQHRRLRCGNYRLGIQLGKGNPQCIGVEWLTEVSYGTMQRQCNSATMKHIGGGEIMSLINVLKEATCARILVNCTGTCR